MGMTNSPRDRRLEASRARRQRVGRKPTEPPTGRRYSEADIDLEAGGKRGKPPGEHATDLRAFLRMHYGYSFEVRENILEGQSNNMRALRVACLARRDPLAAARMVNAWLGAELNAGVVRGKQMYFGEDEFNSNNYLSWTCGGHLGTLKELEAARSRFVGPEWIEIEEAIFALRRWLGMTQALLAVLAVPGRIKNLGGHVTYEGPVVFSVGLRSIARREGNNARTPVASALLGGGRYVGDPGPLATAIQELSDELVAGMDQGLLAQLWEGPIGTARWRYAVERSQVLLAGIRTAMHFQARVYADGTKVSMLLGPKGVSSTQETRLVIVRGPEITDATVITPHAEGDERTVPASDASIAALRVFETWTEQQGRRTGPIFRAELTEGDPVLQLDTYPDRSEEW